MSVRNCCCDANRVWRAALLDKGAGRSRSNDQGRNRAWIWDSREPGFSVHGSTRGIGRAIAETFAAEGANVGICSRNQANVDSAVAALKAKGVAAFGDSLDVSDGAALKAWVSDMASKLGGVDVVVANVSALSIGQDEESWEKEFSTDMMGTVRLVNAAMRILKKALPQRS